MRWSFGPEFWLLAVLSAAAALLYGVLFVQRPPSLLRTAIKALAAGALSAAFAMAGGFALAFALGAAAIADALLGANKKLLPLATTFFLLIHLFYLAALLPLWIFAGDLSPLWPRYAAMVLIVLCVLGTLAWIAPGLRWWAVLVVPYAVLLTATCFAAMWIDWRGWPAILGAELWLSGHILFAAARFRPLPFPSTPQSEWWTYAGAHALLATGIALAAPYVN